MEEYKRQLVLFLLLLSVLIVFVFVYKSDYFWNIAKGLPLHTNSGNCMYITDKICLAEDAGLRVNYYEASSLCSKRSMHLPTLDEAWQIWISSENCQRAFASNLEVPLNKSYFKQVCGDASCYKYAKEVSNYCATPKIKFPLSYQYKNGSFWLKDGLGHEKHYVINFSTGKVGAYSDSSKKFGVRCVK